MKNATKLATEYETALQTIWAAEKAILQVARKIPVRGYADVWELEMGRLSRILKNAEISEKLLRKEMDAHPTAWDKRVKVVIKPADLGMARLPRSSKTGT